jgi:hypothetical protein
MSYRDKVWRKKDGSFVKVCEMSTSHIINTIKMLEKKGNKFEVALKTFNQELRYRKLNRIKTNSEEKDLF